LPGRKIPTVPLYRVVKLTITISQKILLLFKRMSLYRTRKLSLETIDEIWCFHKMFPDVSYVLINVTIRETFGAWQQIRPSKLNILLRVLVIEENASPIDLWYRISMHSLHELSLVVFLRGNITLLHHIQSATLMSHVHVLLHSNIASMQF